MPLKNKVAIVTGSATGLGAAVALRLADQGCNVVINYTKSEAEAETLAACEAKASKRSSARAMSARTPSATASSTRR